MRTGRAGQSCAAALAVSEASAISARQSPLMRLSIDLGRIPAHLHRPLHVMPGLDPGIDRLLRKMMDCRVKPGNDDGETLRSWKMR
jgi:hypothetical protein